jgi:DNA-binding NarL/FixJ family response regulator
MSELDARSALHTVQSVPDVDGVPPAAPGAPADDPCQQSLDHWVLRLSTSQVAAIVLVAMGLTDHEIASAVHLSPHTVRHQIAAAMRRATARSRTELVARCFAAGVLVPTWPPRSTDVTCLCPKPRRPEDDPAG